jgi:L-arabonate dehydrase
MFQMKNLRSAGPDWKPLESPARGYAKLHETHVMQADTGCDLDFLVGKSGAEIPRESH